MTSLRGLRRATSFGAFTLGVALAGCGDSSSGGLHFGGAKDGGNEPGSGGSTADGGIPGSGGAAGSSQGGRGAGGASSGGAGGSGGAGATCTTNTECGASAECVSGTCVPYTTCQNSLDCGENVCNPSTHRCVECVTAADCSTNQACSNDHCLAITACTSDKQCTPQGQLCDTGAGHCVDCLQDGDCDAGRFCSSGACVPSTPQSCSPSARFCDGNVVRQCDGTGQSSTTFETCTGSEFCDAKTAACVARTCTPNAAACDGTRATKCNADGTGYLPGGQECAPSLSCSKGACVSCGAGGGTQSSIRMVEVMVGTPEYIVLENHGTCPVDIGGMMLAFDTSYSSGVPSTYTLPARTLAAGEKVFVLDDTATPETGDILTDVNIDWQATYGGTALLCAGDCATVGSVVDAIAFQGGQAPPPLPAPVTFTPALTAITSANEQSDAFFRTAYAGTYPGFVAGDWSMATATRQGSSGLTCPGTQPTPNTFCTAFGLSCPYGNVTCTCPLVSLYWSCL